MRGESAGTRGYLFLGGPAHGKYIALTGDRWSYDVPVHVEQMIPVDITNAEPGDVLPIETERTTYVSMEVAFIDKDKRYPDYPFGTAYTRRVWVPQGTTQRQADADLREHLLQEWIKADPDAKHEGVRV